MTSATMKALLRFTVGALADWWKRRRAKKRAAALETASDLDRIRTEAKTKGPWELSDARRLRDRARR